jgi:hypothetical protein
MTILQDSLDVATAVDDLDLLGHLLDLVHEVAALLVDLNGLDAGKAQVLGVGDTQQRHRL